MGNVPRQSIFADRLAEHAAFASGDADVFTRRGQWRSFFKSRIGPLFSGKTIVEVGCSDAASLVAMAAKHPADALVGLDWKAKQIFLGAERVASIGLRNVALLRARAQDLPRIFSDGEIDELLIFHPEPCDRPEELANRLFGEPFLTAIHPTLREGAAVTVKTDHAGYYQWMLTLFGITSPDFAELSKTMKLRTQDLVLDDALPPPNATLRRLYEVSLYSHDFWNDQRVLDATAHRCFASEVTMFEQRFLKKRQPIFYFELRKR
jgi:tRNA G46 methylase TrmB